MFYETTCFLFRLQLKFRLKIYRNMKNLKKFPNFLNEWIDSPGSVDVPGPDYEQKVNSRNYTPAHQQLPEVIDAMYEKAYFNDFLDEQGKCEDFNKFVKEGKKSAADITSYIKDSFDRKTSTKDK